MSSNIPLAVALQIVGSFCFALAALYQSSAVRGEVKQNKERRRLSFRNLVNSIKNPRWWYGICLVGISLVCQVTALFFAPVSIVQPVGLLAFPWSMILQAKVAKRRMTTPVIWLVIMTVAATAAFTIIVALNPAPPQKLVMTHVLLGACVVYLLAAIFGLLGAYGPKRWRSLFWASGGAMFYGLEAALVKALINYAHQGHGASDPLFWIVLALLIIGSLTAGWMVQQGYATGHTEIVVASMTITSPVIAVFYGMSVLGEGAHFPPAVWCGIILCAVVAIGGVLGLTWMKEKETVLVEAKESEKTS